MASNCIGRHFFEYMKYLLVVVWFILISCSNEPKNNTSLFANITPSTGIEFRNDLQFTEQLNPYTYRNFYNGGGVAIGDINNDGLSDIYFAGNQVENKLYLNEGNMKFRDISLSAGVACPDVWSTGVTFVDINADGYLDIYVCKSGSPDAPKRHNELFVNNGNLTFTEKSKEYGLDITGLSVHAAFFDYDKDGDLDCYLLTNSIKSVGNYDLVKNQREIPDAQGGGNKFFINDNGVFRDYTDQAGIYHSSIGFGLGVTLSDFNDDSWTDIFVSNDFFERDYLYINKQDGTFEESLTTYFESISMGSMGADVADLDNDGNPELFVTEMLPDSLSRRKTKTLYESWDKYQLNIENGYYQQFPRNVLHKNMGNESFVEVGRMAGVAASEWSWGALLFDMNNDGLRDIFVANGIYKDLLDRDYLTYEGTEERIREMISHKEDVITKLVDLMPSQAVPNYAYWNKGGYRFENVSEQWGFNEPMFSSGSAYGDLDNDGDLDLVINNVNGLCAVYQNKTDTAQYKSLSLSFEGNQKNIFGVGTKVTVYTGRQKMYAENYVTRGYQSSVDPKMVLGLGTDVQLIDSIFVQWPDNSQSVLHQVKPNQHLILSQSDATLNRTEVKLVNRSKPLFLNVRSQLFTHKGSGLIDFNRNRLLPMMYSNETPFIISGDIDLDGYKDYYVGGGKDQLGSVIKIENGKLSASPIAAPSGLAESEETKGALFDVDGDGDLDLYMAAGGRFYPNTSSALIDKILLNNGKGEFTASLNPLPFSQFISTSVAIPIDFDGDGDSDLLVGERFDPFNYGLGGRGYLLENNGQGVFKDVTSAWAPQLEDIGMITDAKCVDIDRDGSLDLVIVGDWMPIVVLKNEGNNFKDISAEIGLKGTEGWWHTVEVADLNRDGKMDFVVGNHGLNSFFRDGDRMYVYDFDRNGSVEQIFCTRLNEKYYPILDKDELLSQLPSLKKELVYYKNYGTKSIDDLFLPEVLEKAKKLQVNKLATVMLLSNAAGYGLIDLPLEAQYSPIYGMAVADIDGDGVLDLVAGGNQYLVKPQFGRYDASSGWFFKGNITGDKFSFDHGIDLGIKGQIRDIEYIQSEGKSFLLVSKFDSELEVYEIHK